MEQQNQNSAEGQTPRKQDGGVSHILCREIQAPVAASLIRGFAKEVGMEKALEIATAAVQEVAFNNAKMTAEEFGGNSIKELARFVREVWAEDDAITLRVLEENENTFRFDVTRCRYAELYEGMGMVELGNCLSCCRDEAFTRGFNPQMKMTRTQTIMEGKPTCDFQFTIGDTE